MTNSYPSSSADSSKEGLLYLYMSAFERSRLSLDPLSPLLFGNLHMLLGPSRFYVGSRKENRKGNRLTIPPRSSAIHSQFHFQLCRHCCSIVVCGGRFRMIFYTPNRPSDWPPPSQTHRQSIPTRQHRQTSRDNRENRHHPSIVHCLLV